MKRKEFVLRVVEDKGPEGIVRCGKFDHHRKVINPEDCNELEDILKKKSPQK